MIAARTNAAPGTAPGPGGCGGAAAGRGSPRSAGSGRVPVAGGWESRVYAVCIQRGAPSRCSPTFLYPGFPQNDLSGAAVLSACEKSARIPLKRSDSAAGAAQTALQKRPGPWREALALPHHRPCQQPGTESPR